MNNSSSKKDENKKNIRLIEDIKSFVKGFKGYSDREVRRGSDSVIRNSIVNELKKGLSIFTESLSSLSTPPPKDLTTLIDIINYRITRLIDIIEKGEDEYPDFFNLDEIDLEILDKVMSRDLKLLKISGVIMKDIVDIYRKGFIEVDIRNRLLMIIESLKVLEDEWKQRLNILKDCR